MTHTPPPEPTDTAAQPDAESAPVSMAKATGFASLFSVAKAASGKQDDQPWHQKGNKSAHEKKIGPAPNGTRRSMGKR